MKQVVLRDFIEFRTMYWGECPPMAPPPSQPKKISIAIPLLIIAITIIIIIIIIIITTIAIAIIIITIVRSWFRSNKTG